MLIRRSGAQAPCLAGRGARLLAAETRGKSALLAARRLTWFGDGAKPHQRVIGAPVCLAPHVDQCETQVDQPVARKRERRVVERLQERAGDEMRLLMAALARPGVQRELMLLAALGAGRPVGDARLA